MSSSVCMLDHGIHGDANFKGASPYVRVRGKKMAQGQSSRGISCACAEGNCPHCNCPMWQFSVENPVSAHIQILK